MDQTPLSHFRAILDHLDPEVRQDQLTFFLGVEASGPAVVEELAERTIRTITARGLRLLTVEAAFYHPWPQWVPLLARLLRHEKDPYLMTTGVRALGRIATPEALAALRDLSALRQGTEFQSHITAVLARADPAEAFRHHLERLLEGSTHAAVANEAARQLEHLVDNSSLESLIIALQHPDLLIHRHALRLLIRVGTPEAVVFLEGFFLEGHRDVLEDRRLKEALAALRGLSGLPLREAAVERLAQARPDLEGHLQAFRGEGSGSAEALEALRKAAGGPLDQFLVEAIAVSGDPRLGPLQALFAETGDALHQRSRRLAYDVDTAAEGLAALVKAGLVDVDHLLPDLAEAFHAQTGREGVARALARLVPVDHPQYLDLILLSSDGVQRAAALEVLGERQEPALQPILLRACKDPIEEVAQRAREHLGRLPGLEDLIRQLLALPNLDDQRLGLKLAALHRPVALLPDLAAFLEASPREELSLAAVVALGALGIPEAGAPLLERLHSGQTADFQRTLAEALRDLAHPETTEALGARASELKVPLLHAICVEAIARTQQALRQPLLPVQTPMLWEHVRGAWSDVNPWPLRLRVAEALAELTLADPDGWHGLSALLRATLQEKRPPTAWTAEETARFQAIERTLAQRAVAG